LVITALQQTAFTKVFYPKFNVAFSMNLINGYITMVPVEKNVFSMKSSNEIVEILKTMSTLNQ